MAVSSVSKKSGGYAAAFVGFVTAVADGGHPFGPNTLMLLFFFLTSSKVTKAGARVKRRLEGSEWREGGQRTAAQVFCNSAGAVLACLFCISRNGFSVSYSQCGVGQLCSVICLGWYAACAGDTWASEIGSWLGGKPILITTLSPTLPGTNGGVSLVGTLASAAGGFVVGFAAMVSFAFKGLGIHTWMLVSGACAGLFGSFIDSLLGATLQYSGVNSSGVVVNKPNVSTELICGRDVLSNNSVNLLSASASACLTAVIFWQLC